MKELLANENSSHGFLPELGRWEIIFQLADSDHDGWSISGMLDTTSLGE